MSDFVYASVSFEMTSIRNLFCRIYQNEHLKIFDYSGDWGHLMITRGHYGGFDPIETNDHIAAVIGGPVLTFRPNDFLSDISSNEGTKSILHRWIDGHLHWIDDLDGPYVIVIIEKKKKVIHVVTDIGFYIPVFCHHDKEMYLSTHIDVVAKAGQCLNDLDQVALLDFFINGTVTYPHTVYSKVYQIKPACVHTYSVKRNTIDHVIQWTPKKYGDLQSKKQEADRLRDAIKGYIHRVTFAMEAIGCFISGGEDSRFVLSILPDHCRKEAYIFLDDFNKEGIIAKKAAAALNATFHFTQRDKFHYLDIIKDASLLIGSGLEYKHCHAFGLEDRCDLSRYHAFFGGYQADTMLKGYWSKITRYLDNKKVNGTFINNRFTQQYPLDQKYLDKSILDSLHKRKQALLQQSIIHQESFADEWFFLWPRSMGPGMVNFFCTRRLFASYECFMTNEVLKTLTRIPQSWRLDRKLYHMMTKPEYAKTKFLRTSKGDLPYFGFSFNDQLNKFERIKRKILFKITKQSKHDGPWADWGMIIRSERWENLVKPSKEKIDPSLEVFSEPVSWILMNDTISYKIKLNILQMIIHVEHLKSL